MNARVAGLQGVRLTPPVPLPVVLRHALAAAVVTMAPRTGTPGWCDDLVRALWHGEIEAARGVLRGYGQTALLGYSARPDVAYALALAIDAAMHIVEQHGVAAFVANADHEARVARLCEYVPPGGWP